MKNIVVNNFFFLYVIIFHRYLLFRLTRTVYLRITVRTLTITNQLVSYFCRNKTQLPVYGRNVANKVNITLAFSTYLIYYQAFVSQVQCNNRGATLRLLTCGVLLPNIGRSHSLNGSVFTSERSEKAACVYFTYRIDCSSPRYGLKL